MYNSIQKLWSNQNYLVSRSTIVDIYPGNQKLQITKPGSMTRSCSSRSHSRYHTVYRQNSPQTPPCSPSVVHLSAFSSRDSPCSWPDAVLTSNNIHLSGCCIEVTEYFFLSFIAYNSSGTTELNTYIDVTT